MKKSIQVLLITFLALSMVACGGAKVDDTVVMQDETVVEDNNTEVSEDVKENIVEDVADDVEVADVTEGETVDTEPDTTEAAEESTGYYPGTFTETGYETEFLGLRFTTPEGYVLSTPEELAELMGTTMDALTESGDVTAIQKKYAELNTIYELMATDSIGAVNVNIVLEKTILPLSLYLDVAKEQFANMSGMTITINSEEEVEFAGATYTKMAADVVMDDIPIKQDYYFRELDGYMMLMTVTWVEGYETELETMMSSFSAF